MTYAPACVSGARTYLISRGIPGNGLGITGDARHKATGGYHCGNDWLADVGRLYSDYSKRQSWRDRPGSNAAMALDIGGISRGALASLCSFLVAEAKAGRLPDCREIMGPRPGGGVQFWDALGLRTGASADHDWHIHMSFFRDSEGRDKTAVFRRYYEPANVVPESAPVGATEEDEEMYLIEANGANGVGAYALVTADGKCLVRLKTALTGGADTANLWSRIARKPADNVTAKVWNDTMELFGVVGYRFDTNANLQA